MLSLLGMFLIAASTNITNSPTWKMESWDKIDNSGTAIVQYTDGINHMVCVEKVLLSEISGHVGGNIAVPAISCSLLPEKKEIKDGVHRK